MIEIFKNFLNGKRLPPEFVSAAALTLMFAIWLPECLIKFNPMKVGWALLLCYILLLCLCSLLVDGIEMLIFNCKMKKRHKNHSYEEKKCLRPFLKEGKKRRLMDVSDPVVAGLMRDCIFEQISNIPNNNPYLGGNGRTTFSVEIVEREWRYLKENPKLLDLLPDPNDD